ncbi:MAG TPA: hypothetical protein VKT17_06345, partial [Acidobacteriota bacterium]|nr:hypothetical protein [Acidobacteriota bacterium]
PPWLDTSVILRAFGNSLEVLKLEHERYLGTAAEDKLEKDMKNASRLGILGGADFIDKIRRSCLKDRMENPDQELCELRRLRVRPEISDIQDEINRELGAENRLAKKCIIFLARKRAGFKLREIGDYLDLSPGAVSLSYHKTSKDIVSNETLRRVIEAVWSRLSVIGQRTPKEGETKKV